jgi:hypothetical protein
MPFIRPEPQELQIRPRSSVPRSVNTESIYDLTVLNQETKRERPSSKGTFGS